MKRLTILWVVVLVLAVLPAAAAGAGEAAPGGERFQCADPLGCVEYGPGEPVRLGTALATTGPLEGLGVPQLNSVELALADWGTVAGRTVELRNEDSGCSADQAVAAANTLVADQSIAAVIGTTCSGAAGEAAAILSDAGYTMVSGSNTGSSLTNPASRTEGYLRTASNEIHRTPIMARFLVDQGHTTSAVIATTDSDAQDSAQAFIQQFEALGGTNLTSETVDFDGSGAAQALADVIAAGPPDVLMLPVWAGTASVLVAEARSMPSLDATVLAGQDQDGFVEGMGAESEGMILTGYDETFTSGAPYQAFAAAYLARYGEDPGAYTAQTYDAALMVLSVIERVAVVDEDGSLHIGRQALRDALFATAGFPGATGTISCDAYGDSAASQFVIVEVVNGSRVINVDASPPWCAGEYATVWGLATDDVLVGTNGHDVMHGGPGNDEIRGNGGNDTICAGDGDDTVIGGGGDDTLFGEAGNDLVKGLRGDDAAYGGPGDDRLQGMAGVDFLDGGDDKDKLWGGIGADTLRGGDGNDQLRGGRDDDTLYGDGGTDRMWGDSGFDVMYGGDKSDFLYGGIDDDTMYGGDGNDRLFGWTGADMLFGENGRDQLRGQAGDDANNGGPDWDWCSLEPVWIDCEATL